MVATAGASKFKFVSPGVQIQEIDNSRLPGVRAGLGPVVVGRSVRGPALRPVTVGSFSEYIEIFGNPSAGGAGGDIWRDGNNLAPTYGAYAAQAWLKNNNNLTFVRLLGAEHQDATVAGQAGWSVGSSHDGTQAAGGAFGLFLIDSGSTTSANTGTLAAIFYVSAGSVELSGTDRTGSINQTGTAVLIASQGTDKEFKAFVRNGAGTITDTLIFNFNRNSKKYIRSVCNTNPTLLNSSITNTSQLKNWFLGETFDRSVDDWVTGTAAGGQFGVILSLQSGSIDQNDQRMSMSPAKTGWFISQHLDSATGSFDPSSMTRLFRIVSHDSGEWEQKNLKVSIVDIKASTNLDDPYGTFSVVIRRAQDADNSVQVLERFTACSLNPFSPNYIAKKIGDKYMTWDDTERRYRDFGNYDNNSRYCRVEMNADVDAGATNPELLPFGYLGPVRFRSFNITSGSSTPMSFGTTGTAFAGAFVVGSTSIVRSRATAAQFVAVGTAPFTGSFVFPGLPLRSTSRQGNIGNPKEAYFGIDAGRANSTKFDTSYGDVIRKLPEELSDDVTNAALQYSHVFTLDDVRRLGSTDAQWASGSRASGASFTAQTGTYTAVLTAGFDRFTAPLYNGFDGLDITEKEPFNNRVLSGQDQTTSYEFNSVKRALDSVADPEVVQCNLLTVPGITNTGITNHVLNIAENRRDTLGIIDLEGGFLPATENTNGDSAAANRGDVDTTISSLKSRGINSSYGASYYPWVQIKDPETGASLWAPPSIAGLGTISFSERKSELWYAPAGFTRGGLTDGAAGIPVTGVRQKLTSLERDKLYEAGINPIGSLPAEGIVIFGQKTLQTTPSALDRINVRRLMNHIKVELANIAANLLFEPNLQTTWDRFRNQAEGFLGSIKTRFGLSDFRVILDEKTTTADLIDRNTMYAQVFLKPARAIEFIAIDAVITNSGVSFDD